jgi:putative phosphoribosyl transferase
MFVNRVDAGRQLAKRLEHLRGRDVLVLGLPRGGVPVAYEIAVAIDAPLDVIVVRKLGVPWNPEVAMGAVGAGVRVVDEDSVRVLGISPEQLHEAEARENREVTERERYFRNGLPPLDLTGKTVVIVDDGIATGATARAACRVARAAGASHVILAVPVAPPDWKPQPGVDADEFICVETPSVFFAIGQWYEDFTQTENAEVMELLQRRAGT